MEELRERVAAVERALTDGESDLTALAEGAARAERVDSLAADVERLEDDVAELQAATQALRGYVGNIRSVNEGVEDRADGAVAAVEKLEERVESLEASNRSADDRARASRPGERAVRTESARPSPAARDGRHGSAEAVEPGADACRACGRPAADRGAAPDGSPPSGPKNGPAGRAAPDGNAAPDGGDVTSKTGPLGQSRPDHPGRQPARRGRDRLSGERESERAEAGPTEEGLLQRFRERL